MIYTGCREVLGSLIICNIKPGTPRLCTVFRVLLCQSIYQTVSLWYATREASLMPFMDMSLFMKASLFSTLIS